MDQFTQLLSSLSPTANLTPELIVFHLLLALVFGLLLQGIYLKTHAGPPSRSFVLTLLLLTIISSAAMMIIRNNLFAAFGLVGAFSIIRFRTVIKETTDIAFIFLALVSGMGAGTGNAFIIFFTIALVAGILFFIRFIGGGGDKTPAQFLLILSSTSKVDIKASLRPFFSSMNLLEGMVEKDKGGSEFHYDVVLKKGIDPSEFLRRIRKVSGLERVRLLPTSPKASY